MTLEAPAPSIPLVICGSCHLLSGVARLPDGTVGQVYRCDCGRVPKEIVTPPLPKVRPISTWEDIGKTIRRITICTCCGAAVLPAHHRFAPYHCTPCAVRVRSVNALAGQLVVPLGSHSLLNGIDPVEDPAAVPESVWSAVSVLLGDRIDEHGPPVFRHVARGREVQQAIRAHQARRTSDLVRRARDAGLIPGPSGGNVLPGQLTAAGRYLWTDYDAALIELVEAIARGGASDAASSAVPTLGRRSGGARWNDQHVAPGEAQTLAEIVLAGGCWRGNPRRDALPVVEASGDIAITTADGDRDWVWQLPVSDAKSRSRTADPGVRWTAYGDPLLLLASPDRPMVAIAGSERRTRPSRQRSTQSAPSTQTPT